MEIYDLTDASGQIVAFEINNAWMSRRGACEVVRAIPRASILKETASYQINREGLFCEFELDGQRFQIRWPRRDNWGRYWIGSVPPRACNQLAVVRAAFSHHKLLFGLDGGA